MTQTQKLSRYGNTRMVERFKCFRWHPKLLLSNYNNCHKGENK